MNKKRLTAIIVLILIALLYAATLVFAVIDSPFAKSCLMAALFCTIVLPVIAYVYLKLIVNLKEQKQMENMEYGENPEKEKDAKKETAGSNH